MNNSELLGGLVWLGLGALIIKFGVDHGIGQVNDPGTGFALYWAGIVMCALSAGVVATAVVQGGPTVQSLWTGTRWEKVVVVLVVLAVYTVLFARLGFLVATIPLVLVLMRVVDPVRWSIAVPVALLVPLGAWWVLQKLLLIQLPAGDVWESLRTILRIG